MTPRDIAAQTAKPQNPALDDPRPSPDITAFAAYPEVIASFLEGHRYVGIDTTDRAVDGTELRIIETFQLPKDYDPDWSSVMSSSQDIANFKQAELLCARARN